MLKGARSLVLMPTYQNDKWKSSTPSTKLQLRKWCLEFSTAFRWSRKRCWSTLVEAKNKSIHMKYFDTRYLVFYNTSPPRMFLSLDLLWEYRIQHGANGPPYVTSSYSTWIFCRGVSGFATDCPCGVWCRGLTTCLVHVGPPFGNRILNNSWAVGLT